MKVHLDNKKQDDREIIFDAVTPGNDYFTYTANGVSLIGHSSDRFIIRRSYINGRIWSIGTLRQFNRLAHEYYDIDDTKMKYFFDIGANIGTTCISFYKAFDQNVKLVAFEPVQDNYRLLKINALLNDLPDDAYEFVNKALGARVAKGTFEFKGFNTGLANVEYSDDDSELEGKDNITDIETLDEFVVSRNIDPKEIKYIWIDTEGFEPEVIKGAGETLSRADIPVFLEFTPEFFRPRANTEVAEFVDLLSRYYSKYIKAGTNDVHELRDLLDTPDRVDGKLNQFDIFLIK